MGKSCVIKRYCEEKFVSKYISTIGIDYGVKPVMVNGAEVRVNFWDLSGLPEYLEVRNEFYKDTQGGILMFDVSSRRSFEALDSWLREAAKFGAGKFPCILCGNKVDRPRVVSEDEAKAYALSKGFEYFETSAHWREHHGGLPLAVQDGSQTRDTLTGVGNMQCALEGQANCS